MMEFQIDDALKQGFGAFQALVLANHGVYKDWITRVCRYEFSSSDYGLTAQCVEWLLKEGYGDANEAYGSSRVTALHTAAGYGNLGVVDILLRHGAQVNAMHDIPSRNRLQPRQSVRPIDMALVLEEKKDAPEEKKQRRQRTIMRLVDAGSEPFKFKPPDWFRTYWEGRLKLRFIVQVMLAAQERGCLQSCHRALVQYLGQVMWSSRHFLCQ